MQQLLVSLVLTGTASFCEIFAGLGSLTLYCAACADIPVDLSLFRCIMYISIFVPARYHKESQPVLSTQVRRLLNITTLPQGPASISSRTYPLSVDRNTPSSFFTLLLRGLIPFFLTQLWSSLRISSFESLRSLAVTITTHGYINQPPLLPPPRAQHATKARLYDGGGGPEDPQPPR